MKTMLSRPFLRQALIAINVGLVAGATAQDVSFFGVAKGARYSQTSTAAPGLLTNAPFVFESYVLASDPDAVLGATLLLATNEARVLSLQPQWMTFTEFLFRDSFASQAALDGAYPSGSYSLRMATLNDGTTTKDLNLPGRLFPNAPRLSNYNAAQAVNPTNSFVLNWDALAGGTIDDLVQVSIFDTHGRAIFETPGWPDFDALDGTATSVVLPAYTLPPGKTMSARVRFLKNISRDGDSYPGAIGSADYFAETQFSVASTGPVFSFTTTTLPVGGVGEDYEFRLDTALGIPPYRWSLAAGSLTGGLDLDPDSGEIRGIPAAAGTNSFTARVIDSASHALQQTFSLSVTGSPAPLSIGTTNLPGGELEMFYVGELFAIGGAPPDAWALAPGSGPLPPGLALHPVTGLISGVPRESGTYNLNFQLADGTGQTAQKQLAIFIPPSVPSLPLRFISPTLLANGRLRFQALGETDEVYTVETSLDLTNWFPIFATNSSLVTGAWEFDPPNDGNARRYYRARLGGFASAGEPMEVGITLGTNTVCHPDPNRGASLILTNAGGVVFTLTIPSNSMAFDAPVCMTLVKSIDGLPFSIGLLGAVRLEPEGMFFMNAATLAIRFTNAAPPDLLGFASENLGQGFHLYPHRVDGNTVYYQIMHFSEIGAGQGTVPNCSAPPPCKPEFAAEQEIAQALCAAYPALPDYQVLSRIFTNWYHQSVRPKTKAAETDETMLGPATREFMHWWRAQSLFGNDPTGNRAYDKALGSLLKGYHNAINKAHAKCVNDHDLDQVATMLRLGRELNFLIQGNGDMDEILDRISRCFRFELEMESITEVDYTHGSTGSEQVRSAKILLAPDPTTLRFGPCNGKSGNLKRVNFYLDPRLLDAYTRQGFPITPGSGSLIINALCFNREEKPPKDLPKANGVQCPPAPPDQPPPPPKISCVISVDDPMKTQISNWPVWVQRFDTLHAQADKESMGTVMECFTGHDYFISDQKWIYNGNRQRLVARATYNRSYTIPGSPVMLYETTTLDLFHAPKPLRKRDQRP